MKHFIQEFKTFALKGNMIDLAIGVIIGTAFNKVVSSLVSDLLMPLLGLFIGSVSFNNLVLNLHFPGSTNPPIPWKIGSFITAVIDFLIISLTIFFVIKGINRLRGNRPQESAEKKCPLCRMKIPKAAKKCGHCCSEIN